MTAPGRLLLVPNTLDLGSDPVELTDVLPLGVIRQAAALQHWVVEDARSARAFLRRVDTVAPIGRPLAALHITELPRPPKGRAPALPASIWPALLQPALEGADIGLLSEAGLPAVADPGSALVAAAHAAGIAVVPLPGASALLLTLAASGLNGQGFVFHGYLPQDAAARHVRIRELEATSRRSGQTQIVIETPYRNAALLAALLETLAPATRLAVAWGLTLPQGGVRSDTVARWRARPTALPERLPAVMAWLAG